MVSIGSSFTVVGYNNSYSNVSILKESDSENINDRIQLEEEQLEELVAEKDGFKPPLATWYDKAHEHFVVYHGAYSELSGDKSEGSDLFSSTDLNGEVVQYRVLRFPEKSIEEINTDATDKEEIKNIDHESCLDSSSCFPVFLPFHLSRKNSCLEISGAFASPSLDSAPKIPILAKFSLDMQLLALQMSPTLLIIVRATANRDGKHNRMKSSSHKYKRSQGLKKDQLWIIDLAKEFPRTFPESFPENWDEESPSTNLLSGGIIWSDHGGNSQDLVLITNIGVIFYKVSISRNQVAKSHNYSHPADAFWFEPLTRTVLVGSYIPHETKNTTEAVSLSYSNNSTGSSDTQLYETSSQQQQQQQQQQQSSPQQSPPQKKKVFIMQTYFLQFPKSNGEIESKTVVDFLIPSFFQTLPSMKLPEPDRLPLFVVGSQRFKTKSSRKVNPVKNNISITNDDICLVNMYGECYCIEVGCMGFDECINIIHLDKVKTRAKVVRTIKRESREPFKISVLDNLLALHYQESGVTFLYDTQIHFFKEELNTFKCINTCEELYDERFSLLPPNLILDPHERGKVHLLQLDLTSIVAKLPTSTCILPFLLRRKTNPELSHSIALKRLTSLIQTKDKVALRKSLCIESAARACAVNDSVDAWDVEACYPLVLRCGLLLYDESNITISALNDDNNGDSKLFTTILSPPSAFQSILTQTEIVNEVLLPQAEEALLKYDLPQFTYTCFVSSLLMENLSIENVEVCPALEVLVIAMLWRLGHAEKVLGILRCRRNHLDREYNSNNCSKPLSITAKKKKNAVFAEMMMLISFRLKIGMGIRDDLEILNMNDIEKDPFTHHFQAMSLDLMQSYSTYDVIAKILLNLGKIKDAIMVCNKVMEVSSSSKPKRKYSATKKTTKTSTSAISRDGIGAMEFFQASILYCEKMEDIGDRVRYFNYLFVFLSKWDASSLSEVNENGSTTSLLANNHQNFPHFLFGGKMANASITLCKMFGFPLNQISE